MVVEMLIWIGSLKAQHFKTTHKPKRTHTHLGAHLSLLFFSFLENHPQSYS